MTEKEIASLRDDIIAWLTDNDRAYLAEDTRIYALGHAWDFNGGKFSDTGEENPRDYFDYAPKESDHILSMSFDGSLYELLNCIEMNDSRYDEFNELFKKHGVYFELGNAWNLTCYEIP